MEKKKKLSFEQFIEKYRFWIGGGLLGLILIGSGIILYRDNYSKPSIKERIMSQESRIEELERKVESIKSEALSTKPASPAGGSETNSNTQKTNAQNDQGTVAGTATVSQGQETSAKSQVVGKININTASQTELESLPGIGPVIAKAIIDYRNANGGFKSIEEVKKVNRIGDKTFEKFKDQITI